MERTESEIRTALPLERYIGRNQIHDVIAASDLFNNVISV